MATLRPPARGGRRSVGWRVGASSVMAIVVTVIAVIALRARDRVAVASPHEASVAPAVLQRLQDVPLLAERTKGAADAPITIIEASDFQCPWCRRFWAETLPALDSAYIETGKAKLIFLNLPIPQLHPNAPAAHEFAMCAAMQNHFWRVHDLLYGNQDAWAPLKDPEPYFRLLADSAGLDRSKLQTCFQTGAVRRLIQQEVEMNERGGIRSTPSFIIENGLLQGAQPFEVWRPILDSIFAAKTGKH
jgi:protein-disulfide isomerase